MSAPAALYVRLARIANTLVWAPLAIVALQIVLLFPLGAFIGNTHAGNVLAGGSLLLTAAGLLLGLVSLPFADRIRWPLRLLMIPVWLVVARLSMIASGF
jgi:hypothetical protein